jgi:hypothetical protein
MFDDSEYEQLTKLYLQCGEKVKQYRQSHGTKLSETPLEDIYQPFYSKYKELAGGEVQFSVEEIVSHHFLSRWKDYQHEANVG